MTDNMTDRYDETMGQKRAGDEEEEQADTNTRSNDLCHLENANV
jgi:hypothetical protein